MEDFAAADRGLAHFLQEAAAARLAGYALHTAMLRPILERAARGDGLVLFA